MISFYPGPSRVHDEIPRYVKDAFALGMMSINHRSEDFVKMSERTIRLLRQKLGVPKDYTVFFTGSATECWEIIAQSIVTESSHHLYNGSFGQKWFEYTKRLRPLAQAVPFSLEEKLDPRKLVFDSKNAVICITQNETSNGTQVSNAIIKAIKKNNASHLVAVDATSSMAGVRLDFRGADIWYASVQKCFGLPAGLALMICSPQAMARVTAIDEKAHYNSLTFMSEMMDRWQTPFTPNVLGIYLLMRVLEDAAAIKDVSNKTVERYTRWLDFLRKRKTIRPLITEVSVQSYTVIPVTADEATIDTIKKAAKKNGFLVGEGYGTYKPITFRIANFPALKDKEIKALMKFLEKY